MHREECRVSEGHDKRDNPKQKDEDCESRWLSQFATEN